VRDHMIARMFTMESVLAAGGGGALTALTATHTHRMCASAVKTGQGGTVHVQDAFQ
jgi:hypothetical protein